MDAAVFDDCEITGVTCDSRQVHPGYLFAAIPGTQTDGRRFIPDALGRGAVAVLAPPGTCLDPPAPPVPPVPLIIDDNPRRQYALMAARFFAAQPRTVACVTGTNGKTSVVSFLRQIWGQLNIPCASAGTLGVDLAGFAGRAVPELSHAINLTTPDPADLHRSLAELAGHGIDHLGLEASSHGLAQYRLDGVRVTAAAFTNLTRDHLDYHHDMDGYLEAKRRLFSDIVGEDGTAVVNADDPYGDAILKIARDRGLNVLTYGAAAKDIVLLGQTAEGSGQVLDVEVLGHRQQVKLSLPGAFQGSNALAALGLAVAIGAPANAALAALANLSGVPGRLQPVGELPNGASIYVDYAHTPDALSSVLHTLRPHTAGRLAVVFGCGGDRDAGKRPEMGAVAAVVADRIIVTDDNPRTENPAAIRAEILAACLDATEIGDRADAIEAAIAGLAAGDVLVVAGKGHETGQIVGDETHLFDDAAVIRGLLERLTS